MRVADLHCDALSRLEKGELRGEVTVETMRRGEALLECFAIFAPWGALEWGEGAYRRYRREVGRFQSLLKRYGEDLAPALSPKDVIANEKAGKISALLSVEGGDFLEGRLSRLEEAKQDGVRMISLTWNRSNELGVANTDDPLRDQAPLTDFGCEAVQRMQELGILVDLSHLNRGGFFHALSCCHKSVVCSHSCCAALCNHRRNLTDAQLRALGQTGSVVGLNYYSRFLREGSLQSRVEDLLAHGERILRLAGEDALALGSDFDGRDSALAFGDWQGVPSLMAAFVRRFGERIGEKIASGNFLRLWKQVQ